MEWLIVESQALCQSSATPPHINNTQNAFTYHGCFDILPSIYRELHGVVSIQLYISFMASSILIFFFTKLIQEAQLPQRDSASATHVFLGSITDHAIHWTPHLLYNYYNRPAKSYRLYQLTNRATYVTGEAFKHDILSRSSVFVSLESR